MVFPGAAGVTESNQNTGSTSDRLFRALADLVTQYTSVVFLLGVIVSVVFSCGLLVAKIETDLDTLWVDLNSRLINEKTEFEALFGGAPRQLVSAVSSSTNEAVFSEDKFTGSGVGRTSNGLAALQQSMQLWNTLNVTYKGHVFRSHDLCERPLVPPDLQVGGRSASMYAAFTQCMQNHSMFTSIIYTMFRGGFPDFPAEYQPLESNWGIDQFPCVRASALDCFREGGEVDLSDSILRLGTVAPALVATVRANDSYIQFARTAELTPVPNAGKSFQEFVALTYPCWLFTQNASLSCLKTSDLPSLKSTVETGVRQLGTTLLLKKTFFDGILTIGAGEVKGAGTVAELQAALTRFHQNFVQQLRNPAVTIAELVRPIVAYTLLKDFIFSNPEAAQVRIGSDCLLQAVAADLQTSVAAVTGHANYSATLFQLESVAQQMVSFGFWHRPSYSGMTEAQIVEYFSRAANNEINPAIRDNPGYCFEQAGRACCTAWNGAYVSTSLLVGGRVSMTERPVPNTGFKSRVYERIQSIRSAWQNYHHRSPIWQELLEASHPNLSWSSVAEREGLARAFDQELIRQWSRLYNRAAGSQYAAGEQLARFKHDFSTEESLRDVLQDASQVDTVIVGLSYGIMAMLIVCSMGNFYQAFRAYRDGRDPKVAMIDSHGLLGLQGLGVIALSSTAGIGFASYSQVVLNGLSINLVPFVSLGLGIDDMFVLAHAMWVRFDRSHDIRENVGGALSLAGPSVCLTSLANSAAFILVYYVPVGAVRQLVVVLFIGVLVNLLLLFLLFVPLMVWDIKRRLDCRMDFTFTYVKVDETKQTKDTAECGDSGSGSLVEKLVVDHYGPLLENSTVKAVVLGLFSLFFCITLWSALELTEDGLPASDIALRDTYQRDIALLSETVFVQQPAYLVTISRKLPFSNPTAQQQILDTMDALQGSPWMIGGTRVGDSNFLANGTSSLLSTYDLVQATGLLGSCPKGSTTVPISNQSCYRSYYADWFRSAGIGYTPYISCRRGSQRVPCTSPDADLVATKTTFALDNLHRHEDYLNAIRDVRRRVDPHSNADVRSFAIGHIFYFWEQYFGIDITLIAAIGFGLLGVFTVTFAIQLNPMLSLIVCVVVVFVEVELTGLLPAMGVKFNPLSVANLVISVGMAVEFSAHYARAFLLCGGSRDERMQKALAEMLPPMVNGALSTIIALSVLALARFPFFRRYYALMFVVMVVVSFVNGLVLLPVLLSLVGPQSASPAASTVTSKSNVCQKTKSNPVASDVRLLGMNNSTVSLSSPVHSHPQSITGDEPGSPKVLADTTPSEGTGSNP